MSKFITQLPREGIRRQMSKHKHQTEVKRFGQVSVEVFLLTGMLESLGNPVSAVRYFNMNTASSYTWYK